MVSNHRKHTLFASFLALSLVMVFFAGCRGTQDNGESSQPAETTVPTVVPTQAPDRVVLTASDKIGETYLSEAQAYISQLAAESGLIFEMRETILQNEITPDVKIIIFLEQPDNLGSLAASAPQTQFVAIGNGDWNPPSNGSIIRKNDDHVAFLAGYLGAMLAPNFRVGALQVEGDDLYNQAFVNGVGYYCGICASVIYPLSTYPAVAQLPQGSIPAAWREAFNAINANKVNVVFFPSGASSPELGTFLASQDIAIIGNAAPLEELREKWVATITTDGLSPLREMWPDLLNGVGGKTVSAGLQITDVNYINLNDGLVWLSQGKMDQLNEVIQLLREGQIYPYSVN